MEIPIASDHGGWYLKRYFIDHAPKGYEFIDFGPEKNEAVDYPDYAHSLAESISKGTFNKGVLICTTGIGMSIAANKHHGVRAALCYNEEKARQSREHGNSNILVLAGGDYLTEERKEYAMRIFEAWVEASFEGGRHERRVGKIDL
jgi:ribose 5-phosphate isomerase B